MRFNLKFFFLKNTIKRNYNVGELLVHFNFLEFIPINYNSSSNDWDTCFVSLVKKSNLVNVTNITFLIGR